jgi:succinyl-CoA synthetase beta subunit
MILYEYEAKRHFREQGISVPQGEVIRTLNEAEAFVRKMGHRAIIKPQVLCGWWGKAGDTQFANTPVEGDDENGSKSSS